MTKKDDDRFQKPWLLKRSAMNRINWNLPEADKEGFKRGMHNGVQASRAFAKMVTILKGQQTPPHAVNCDHIIFQVRGQVEFSLGGEDYRLEEHDMLYYPANARYSFRNVGDCDAEFVSIVTEAEDGWPPAAEYWES